MYGSSFKAMWFVRKSRFSDYMAGLTSALVEAVRDEIALEVRRQDDRIEKRLSRLPQDMNGTEEGQVGFPYKGRPFRGRFSSRS